MDHIEQPCIKRYSNHRATLPTEIYSNILVLVGDNYFHPLVLNRNIIPMGKTNDDWKYIGIGFKRLHRPTQYTLSGTQIIIKSALN